MVPKRGYFEAMRKYPEFVFLPVRSHMGVSDIGASSQCSSARLGPY